MIVIVRNTLFRWGIISSVSFDVPVLCVGNIQIGGTGKTPFVEYLLRELKADYTIAVVSRGYGRGTEGYIEVEVNSDAEEVGDEPLQMKINYPDVVVVVCEDRVEGIEQLREIHPAIDLIILDDGFQHRYVKPYLSVVLSPMNEPFFLDLPFPSGRSREWAWSARRADFIVATKCDEGGNRDLWRRFVRKDRLYFASQRFSSEVEGNVFGFSGLAQNNRFQRALNSTFDLIGFKGFNDHHRYTQEDLDELFYLADGAPLVCTMKDKVKVKTLQGGSAVHVLNLTVEVEGSDFIEKLKSKLKQFEG